MQGLITGSADRGPRAAADPSRPHGLGGLRARIDQATQGILDGVDRLALLEFPAHSNVGDSAIWLGEAEFLARRVARRPAFTSDTLSYSRDRLAAVTGLDAILIHGGGNLGDLWKGLLDTKIGVLEDFRHLPIVQMPQTIHFRDPARLDDYRRAVDRHPRFTLLARDRASFEMASSALDCDVRLCPDMALWLDLARPAAPAHDVVCLLRTDLEASAQQQAWRDGAAADVPIVDWLDEPAQLVIRAERALNRAVSLYPRKLARMEPVLTSLRDRVASNRVQRGCRLLAAGKAVVTDRLHGHILCLLMGMPHVVLDNSYGKVSQFCESWTRDMPDVRFAGSLDEAIGLARSLAAGV